MSHYFHSPTDPAEMAPLRVNLEGAERDLVTAPGVFSAARLDLGTRVLLRTLSDDALPPTDLLDLGCGWGPLALSMALRQPGATVWAVDSNTRALKLTQANAHRLALRNIRVALPEEVPPALRFERLWSNPPIRIGKQTLHDLLATWLGRLTPSGMADLVVQRHLGADSLQAWIEGELGLGCERRASAKGYRVLEVRMAERRAR